jgi:hypothetical protein
MTCKSMGMCASRSNEKKKSKNKTNGVLTLKKDGPLMCCRMSAKSWKEKELVNTCHIRERKMKRQDIRVCVNLLHRLSNF